VWQPCSPGIKRRRVLWMSDREVLRHVVAPLCVLGCTGTRCVRETQFTDDGDIAARSGLGPLFGWLVVEGRHQCAACLDVCGLLFLAEKHCAFWLTRRSTKSTG
jgi:hypothetical protein